MAPVLFSSEISAPVRIIRIKRKDGAYLKHRLYCFMFLPYCSAFGKTRFRMTPTKAAKAVPDKVAT